MKEFVFSLLCLVLTSCGPAAIGVAVSGGGGGGGGSGQPQDPNVGLSKPVNLAAMGLSQNAIGLLWSDHNTNEDGFIIERRTNSKWTEIHSALPNETHYIDKDSLSPGVTYYYRVVAYASTKQSEYSNEADATTNPKGVLVPSDYASIQIAINALSNGFTAYVEPGVYHENINFLGKAISVKSAFGSKITTIDGNQAGSVATFNSNEGLDSILEGFTLTNGAIGVICQSYSSPTIINNIISNNSAGAESGGGIRCDYHASPDILNNTIIWNQAISGGGVFCKEHSIPYMANNTITGNSVLQEGGGINCWMASPKINNNTIHNNTSQYNGGGVHCDEYSNPVIVNNAITENLAHNNGGGIYCTENSNPTIENNRVSDNTANNNGGGVHCDGAVSTIINNNTIVQNTASSNGGGFVCDRSSVLTITNTILWGNICYGIGPEIWIGGGGTPSTLTLNFSDVKGGAASIAKEANCVLNWGVGMIEQDPLFVAGCYLSQTAAGQALESPCVDGGDPSSKMIDGATRTDGVKDSGVVDMGYHYTE